MGCRLPVSGCEENAVWWLARPTQQSEDLRGLSAEGGMGEEGEALVGEGGGHARCTKEASE